MNSNSNIKPHKLLPNLVMLIALGGGALAPAPASAADLYWVCGNDWWDSYVSGVCWSTTSGGTATVSQPDELDLVYLTQSDAAYRTVDYYNSAYPSAVLYSLRIDATGTGRIALNQELHPLAAVYETIGYSGTGIFNQSGGTNTVSATLNLGYLDSGVAFYDLSGSGNLSAHTEYIGHDGSGTLTQSGGTNTVSSVLYLGYGNSGFGTYNLSGTGSMSINSEYIGYSGDGYFWQSGGEQTITHALTLGYNSGSGGIYTLHSGSLSANVEIIGSSGTGAFIQVGGTNTVSGSSGTLALGANSGSTGGYSLYAGSLSVSREYIGWSGTGVFAQSGGDHTVTGTMTLAVNSGSSGTYNLQGGLLRAGTINTGVGTSAFNFTGGTLSVGQFTGNLVNNGGTLAPGSSPATTSITGDYTQSALGAYSVEIGGLLAGTQHDVLNVSGTAFLDGLLNVSLFDLGGGLFAPHAGDTFDILVASTIMGNFSTMSFAALSDPNLFWRIDYLTDAIGTTDVVRLSIGQNATPPAPVPEPETYVMLLAGLGLMGFVGRRRRNSAV